MKKSKITKEDIFSGNYIRRTSTSVKKQYHFTDLLLIYVKWFLGIGIVFALYYGYSIYRDSQLTRVTPEKTVKIWSGNRYSVTDSYTKTGRIVAGKYFYCPKSDTENLILTVKDDNNLTICLELTGITKTIRNKFNRMLKNKDSLREKYLNKTISIQGYTTGIVQKGSMEYAGTIINCDEFRQIFVSKIEITE